MQTKSFQLKVINFQSDKMTKLLTTLAFSAFLSGTLLGISNAFDTITTDGQILSYKHVKYSDPSVNTEYSTNPHFKAKGMQHVYTITHAFLDLVQRKDVLPASINATQILDDNFWTAPGRVKINRLSQVNLQNRVHAPPHSGLAGGHLRKCASFRKFNFNCLKYYLGLL